MKKDELFKEIKDVILAGAKSQPRSVLQIFQSFLSRWEIVKARGKTDEIDKKLLTLILVLQNEYPELFSRVVYYPEHLLYLNALIRKEPFGNFTPIDIDEINNLGLVVDAKIDTNTYKVRYQSEIVRLFNKANIGDYLKKIDIDLNKGIDINERIKLVSMHVVLAREIESNQISNHNDILDVMLSGDIVRIQNLQHKQDASFIFEQYALGNLLILLNTLSDIQKQPKDINQENIILQIEKLLFGWGQLNASRKINKLEELVFKNKNLPYKLRVRCLYVFFHHAFRGDNDAMEVILRALRDYQEHQKNDDDDIAFFVKTSDLLQYVNVPDSSFDRLVSIFESFGFWKKNLAQDSFLESLINAYDIWGYKLIDKINLTSTNIQWEKIADILKKINKTEKYAWPIGKYGSYFRAEIKSKKKKHIKPEKIVNEYFMLLKGHNGKNVQKEVISELVWIIPFAEQSKQEEILNEALQRQYDLQKDNKEKDEWQSAAWQWLETVNENLRALLTMKVYSPGAVKFVHYLYQNAPNNVWKNSFGDILRNISDENFDEGAIMTEKMKKIARQALRKFVPTKSVTKASQKRHKNRDASNKIG